MKLRPPVCPPSSAFGRRPCFLISLAWVWRTARLLVLGLSLNAPGAFAADDAVPLRLGSGEKSLARYQEYGYNAAIIGDVTQLATYDAVCPGVIIRGSDLWKRIEGQREKFQKAYDQAVKCGLAVCLMTDEVSMPIPILARLQKRSSADLRAEFDLDSPEFWDLYRAKYREVLKAYPRVAYVMVRTGENYSHPDEGFIGRTVVHGGKYDDAYFRHMQRLIEETRRVVVDEFGRTLIWRTWDLGNDGFHANPQVYDRVLAGLPERKGLIFAVKFTQTDFWRYNDFNPMIGRGGVKQIVEYECAREYEGKGAFPDYVGPIHAGAMRRMAALGVTNSWIWDATGGWGGPFLKSDRWVRLNDEATSRLARNPALDPRALAQEWAAREFGVRASTNVAEIAMLSADCVLKSQYIAPYARDHHGWKPSLNLMRDDIIRGAELKPLYDGSKNSLPEVFAEKEEAVAIAGRMRALFESSHADIAAERGEPVYQETLGGLIYLESLAKVMCHYVNGMFLYYNWQEKRDPATMTRAEQELQAWRADWQYYQTEVPKLPGVASLYRSQNNQTPDSAKGAMADLCEAALRDLSANAAAGKAVPVDGKN